MRYAELQRIYLENMYTPWNMSTHLHLFYDVPLLRNRLKLEYSFM